MTFQIKELLLDDGMSPFGQWFKSLEGVAAAMALTRDFKETVAARFQADPAFAKALLDEAITLFLDGEPDTAKLVLRDLVNATVGFESLAEEIHKPAKSLHRMLSASGNPTMTNISSIFAAIKKNLRVQVRTKVVAA
jgi:DNA-binding phage protein